MSGEEYKKTIGTFLQNRYDFLLDCAKNITFIKKS